MASAPAATTLLPQRNMVVEAPSIERQVISAGVKFVLYQLMEMGFFLTKNWIYNSKIPKMMPFILQALQFIQFN